MLCNVSHCKAQNIPKRKLSISKLKVMETLMLLLIKTISGTMYKGKKKEKKRRVGKEKKRQEEKKKT